uniref:hypothetical protein n=1 Tax=Amycolatopsis sp. CA-290885 TaxID=3239925 RepID=UPI003F499B89
MSDKYVAQDENDELHAIGTHDVTEARQLAERYVRAEWGIDEPTDFLAAEPTRWWCVQVQQHEDGDVELARVPEGTAGAEPVTTWTC